MLISLLKNSVEVVHILLYIFFVYFSTCKISINVYQSILIDVYIYYPSILTKSIIFFGFLIFSTLCNVSFDEYFLVIFTYLLIKFRLNKTYLSHLEVMSFSVRKFLLTSIVIITCTASLSGQSIDSLVNEVFRLFESREFEKTKLLLEELEKLQLNDLVLANVLEVRALITSDYIKDYELALTYHKRVLELRLANENVTNQELIDSYLNHAAVYKTQGEYTNSIDFFTKALKLNKTVYQTNSLNVRDNYWEIATIYERLGEFDLSFNYLYQSLEITQLLTPHSIDEGNILNSIGLVNLRIKYYDIAREYFNNAILVYEAIGLSISQGTAMMYNNIAVTYAKELNYEKSKEYYNLALKIHKELDELGSLDQALIYNNIATLLSKQGYQNEALKNYEIALKIRKSILGFNHPFVAMTFSDMGTCYLRRKNYNMALNYYQYSIIANVKNFDSSDIYLNPNLDNYFHGISLLRALSYKAQSFKALFTETKNPKDLIHALDTYLLCDSLIDQMKHSYLSENDKLVLVENSSKIYKNCVNTAIDLSEVTKTERPLGIAFRISEKNKSSILYHHIIDAKNISVAGIPDSLIRLEISTKKNITDKKSSLIKNETSRVSDKIITKELEKELYNLNIRYDALINKIQNDYPEYHQLKYSTKTISIKEIQNKLSKKDQALLEYFIGDSSIYLFAITKSNFQVKRVAKDSLFNQQLKSFRKVLHQPNLVNHSNEDYREYTALAHSLYNYLIAPIDFLIAGKELIIIPDGALALIPFEALLTSEASNAEVDYQSLPYLVKEYAISYANSATLLFNEMQNSQDLEVNNNGRILAFAPKFENNLLAYNTEDTVRSKLSPLNWTVEEVNNLSSYFETKIYTNATATEKSFKQEAGNYSILHIASHGLVDDENPMYSKIAFTVDETDTLNDGYLHTFELYNTKLNADMAVLSACNTGYGKVLKGEGVLNLARGFFYAGCKTVVMSLWVANDKSTATLMGDFYKYLAAGQPKNSALQNAKLNYIKNNEGLKAHPYYWSQFIISGNTDPIPINLQSKWIVFLLIGLPIFLLLTIYLLNKKKFAKINF